MTNHDNSLFNEGYDSDCNLPYFDAVADMGEDPDDYDEDIILATAPSPESTTTTTVTATAGVFVTQPALTEEGARKLVVHDLKVELTKQGCRTSGKKAELLARLLEALRNNI